MADAHSFVGTWSLESFHATGPNGDAAHPFGESVTGRITYHADGRMSVQLMADDRAGFSGEDPRHATPDEIVDAFASYLGYYGTFSVDEEAGQVTHHLEGASIPNWTGTDQLRMYEFGDGTLRLSTPTILIDGIRVVSVLLWRRD